MNTTPLHVTRHSIRFLFNLIPIRKALLGIVLEALPLVFLGQIIS